MAGRPRGFHTDLPHGLIYHAGPPAILLVPAEAGAAVAGSGVRVARGYAAGADYGI